ncbi:GNAT family N-acetyltransferase [Microvirga sp. CF3062]|uniref:GNAT family N-acetyltransferase n=1 Tax=Microvirga sp. CF3062 TaxID=3110182 RepID=UPI002E768870|nr:GNAT family N-acetyltransferase [Microvirga sp. CF3062]MEE1655279.1 GNAT family N-acetyltransferase [Microvirga sp. CF3062]
MARFAHAWQRMLVVLSDGTLAGFLLMTDQHIDMLFMDPSAIGRGGGALLLQEAERRGARSLECFHDNHAARHFYERHGWQVEREYDRDFAGRSRSFVFYAKG